MTWLVKVCCVLSEIYAYPPFECINCTGFSWSLPQALVQHAFSILSHVLAFHTSHIPLQNCIYIVSLFFWWEKIQWWMKEAGIKICALWLPQRRRDQTCVEQRKQAGCYIDGKKKRESESEHTAIPFSGRRHQLLALFPFF